MAVSESAPASRWTRYVRPPDLVWLLLFSAMALASPVQNTQSLVFLSALAAFQLAEPRIPRLATRAGQWVAVLIKLGLGYLLIGYTDAINSSYYPILLLPVVSAATTLGAIGTTLVTLLAVLAELSFLLFLDQPLVEYYLVYWRELFLRLIFLPIVGYLTYTLAEANRAAARKYQAVAEQLAGANRSLQEAETAMRRSERLAALGQLTAGLAHELRNPMGTIRASAEMLSKSLGGSSEVAREMAGYIAAEVDRANSLVTRFLEFARPLQLRLDSWDLNEVLDRAMAQLEKTPRASEVSVYRNYSPDIPRVLMDGEWMERVFYNLLLNAAEASPAGGAVTVKTRASERTVEVSFIDRGAGIDRKDLESIFNPFFTTKPDGVGLGLAIVSKIVDEHGGRIAVESEPGKGSVFRVLLPADLAPARPALR